MALVPFAVIKTLQIVRQGSPMCNRDELRLEVRICICQREKVWRVSIRVPGMHDLPACVGYHHCGEEEIDWAEIKVY
jgi:hypothetical protein